MSTATDPTTATYRGNDKLLAGLVLSVVSYWLFAISLGTVAPTVLQDLNGPYSDPVAYTWAQPVLSPTSMNLAVSLTGLVSGLFIVLFGGFADRFGRVRLTLVGNLLNVIGCLFIVLANGSLATVLMITGRAVQGLSAACVMPATIALVKSYWDGPQRQRSVSMWSIGSFGGAGLAAFLGGLTASGIGWRWIFVFSMAVSVIASALVWGTPESRVVGPDRQRFDVVGLAVFLLTMLALMILLTFGGKSFGWASSVGLVLAVLTIAGIVAFVVVERGKGNAFIDFGLFRNMNFTGTVAANFLLNGTLGLLIVSQQLLQIGGNMKALEAGVLTLGYPLMVVLFIRAGEKLLQIHGPRKPMIWGALLVALAAALLMPTNLLLSQYKWLAVLAYGCFGLGLAFFATPATDAALTSLPADRAGTGMGIFKMASSLGGSIGTAVALALFLGFSKSDSANVVGEIIHMAGRQDNVLVREAATIALGAMLIFALAAAAVAAKAVPKGKQEV